MDLDDHMDGRSEESRMDLDDHMDECDEAPVGYRTPMDPWTLVVGGVLGLFLLRGIYDLVLVVLAIINYS